MTPLDQRLHDLAVATKAKLDLKTNAADLAGSSGSTLILHKKAGVNTYARTMRQWAVVGGMDDCNIFNWIDDTLDAAILARSNAVNLLSFFQNAAAGGRGGRLRMPSASYLIDTTAGFATLEEVDLMGQNVLDGSTSVLDQGTMLLIKGTANSPFKVRRGVSVQGLGIYYPDQPDSAAPTVFPATFAFDFTDGPVQFVEFARNAVYNAYKFIDINDVGGNIGHVEIVRNYICALKTAIYLRYNAEHFRVERNNFTFGHWTQATEAGARAYMRANATALQVDQTDGVEFVDNLVFGHLNGTLLSALGLCQMMKLDGNKFDQVLHGIKASGAGNFNGQIVNNTFNAFNPNDHSLQGRAIEISTNGASLETIPIVGNSFNLATEEHIYTSGNGPTRDVLVGVNSWSTWAAWKTAGPYGAINCNGNSTNLQLTGGKFSGGTSAAFCKGVVGTFNTAQITGAEFDLTVAPVDIIVSYATFDGNRSFNTSGALSDIVAAPDFENGRNAWDKPSGKTKAIAAANYAVERRYESLIFSAACTITLPSPASYNGLGIRLLTTGANAIVSASANVIPITGGAAGAAILAAAAGKWAVLEPSGANWQIASSN